MSFERSSPGNPPNRRGPALRRRQLLQLGGAAALSFALPATGAAAQTQPLYRSGRPKLPGMGPSYRQEVAYSGDRKPGTIIVDTSARLLLLVLANARGYLYRISVGREGFGWSGTVTVGAKKEWPEWRPPAEMRVRIPELPAMVPSGPYNPLGARALYLYRGGKDTLYRIHGTNDPEGIGFDDTSGCFRLTNTDIVDLYGLVAVGAAVVVV